MADDKAKSALVYLKEQMAEIDAKQGTMFIVGWKELTPADKDILRDWANAEMDELNIAHL